MQVFRGEEESQETLLDMIGRGEPFRCVQDCRHAAKIENLRVLCKLTHSSAHRLAKILSFAQ